MKVADLKLDDRLEDYRRQVRMTVTAIEPWSGGGNGDIRLMEASGRRRTWTFKQFERLRFIRREEDRR